MDDSRTFRDYDPDLKRALVRLLSVATPNAAEAVRTLLSLAYRARESGNYSAAACLFEVASGLDPAAMEPVLGRLLALTDILTDGDWTTPEDITPDRLDEVCALFERLRTLALNERALEAWRRTAAASYSSYRPMEDPALVGASALAGTYVRAQRLGDARRVLKGLNLSGESWLAEELRALLAQVNDALAEQIEHTGYRAPGLDDLRQELTDGLRAIVRRIELHLDLGAKELTLSKVLDLVASRGDAFPSREAETLERLAGDFGSVWDQLQGRHRRILATVETLYADMAPFERGDAAILAVGYTRALESLLKGVLRCVGDRVTLNQLADTLRRLERPEHFVPSREAEKSIRTALGSPRLAPHREFWTRDAPAALTKVVRLRNGAAHGEELDWEKLRELRSLLMGEPESPGLVRRILQAC